MEQEGAYFSMLTAIAPLLTFQINLMPIGIVLLYIVLVIMLFVWLFRGVCINKEVLVKRVNPSEPNRYGDIVVKGYSFYIHLCWTSKVFAINEIQEIRAYSFQDWGFNDQEYVCISFPKFDVIFDVDNERNQLFIRELLELLNIDKDISWGLLPQLNDPMKRDVLYSAIQWKNI